MKLKNIMLATLAVLLVATAHAQTTDTTSVVVVGATIKKTNDTIAVKVNGIGEVVVIERDEDGNTRRVILFKRNKQQKKFSWDILFDIGFNTYTDRNAFTGSEGGDPFLGLNTSKSVNVAVYPFAGTLRLTKSRMLNLQTGLGIDWGNYRFEDNYTMANVNGQTIGYQMPDELSKSKLVTVYMNVPLMLKLNIPIGGSYRRSFYLGAGVIGGLKLGSHTKIKYEDGGSKEKDHDSFNLNLLRYDLTFRAGYRGIGLYFNYQMSPMFEKNKGPKLFPYAVGLSVTI